jgi:PP-loop superfamily ATP-utilizing enzyme
MYVCDICRSVAGPQMPQLKHVVYKTDAKGRKSISKEMPVCYECKKMLDTGIPLDVIMKSGGKYEKVK